MWCGGEERGAARSGPRRHGEARPTLPYPLPLPAAHGTARRGPGVPRPAPPAPRRAAARGGEAAELPGTANPGPAVGRACRSRRSAGRRGGAGRGAAASGGRRGGPQPGRAAAGTGSRRGAGGNRPQPGRAAHCRSFGPKGVSDTRDTSPKREAAQSRAADDQHRDRGMNSSGAHLQNVGEERAPRPAQRGCRPRRHTSPPAGSGPARRRFCGRPNLARVFLSAVGVGSFLAL